MRAPNVFAHPIDRAVSLRKDAQAIDRALHDENTRFVVLRQDESLITPEEPRRARLLNAREAVSFLDDAEPIFLGLYEESPVFAFMITELHEPLTQSELLGLRAAAPLLDASDASLLAYARALLIWQMNHRFCSRCGSLARAEDGGHVRVCTNPDCARHTFPRTDPAIIVLVSHDDACLLGNQEAWSRDLFSTLAGFVEPGESLEGAVVREVAEEAGIPVTDVSYHSSQPWPFPSSLMLGFEARALSRDVHPDGHEIRELRWFTREELRNGVVRLSNPVSISRRLIEDWIASGG